MTAGFEPAMPNTCFELTPDLKSGDSWEHQTYNNLLKSTILISLNVLNHLKQ